MSSRDGTSRTSGFCLRSTARPRSITATGCIRSFPSSSTSAHGRASAFSRWDADLSQFALARAATYGCDLTSKHCHISRTFVSTVGGRAAIAQADARALPYPSDSFDLVYSFGVLLLIEDLDSAITEIHRVLKPGGTVIVMFYNRQSLHYYLKTLYYYCVVCDMETLLGPRRLVDWFTDGFGYPHTYHQTPDSLRKAFERFTVDSLVVRNLTRDQIPLFPFDEYPAEFWSWLATRLGFYLMLKAHK